MNAIVVEQVPAEYQPLSYMDDMKLILAEMFEPSFVTQLLAQAKCRFSQGVHFKEYRSYGIEFDEAAQ
jgi:hypothetical protein